MALLRLLSFPSTTSFSLIEPSKFSSFSHISTLSLSPRKRISRLYYPIRCSSSTLTAENPSESKEDEISPTRLLAQNVPWSSTANDIRALFQQHGTVVDIELSMHSKTRNRGLAFVEMGSAEEAAQALAKLEAFEYEGRTLKLNYARQKKKKDSPPVEPKPAVVFNLFVANLSFEARAKDLKEFFQSDVTDVVSAEVIFHDNPRRSSGYGFVSFKTKKEADEALKTFQGKELMGRPIRVARSKQFVKLESEMNSELEDNHDVLSDSSCNSEQAETVENI